MNGFWRLILATYLVGLMCVPPSTHANVFAAHLEKTQQAGQVEMRYRLNENATSVQVQVLGPLPASNVLRSLAGTTTKGLNVVSWDLRDASSNVVPGGEYVWQVVATDGVGHTLKYDQLSSDASTTSKYYYATGVCSNTNQDSDYFGCLYVSSGEAGTTDGRTTTEGIYILHNDLTPFTSQGDTAFSGGIPWSSWFSPMRVRLDGEGNLIISDWSDAHSGLWMTSPDCLDPFVPLLATEGRDIFGLCANHGSIMSVWPEGSGASRVLYTIDEDYTIDDETTGSILKYEIGQETVYSTTPSLEYDDHASGDLIVSGRCQHVRDDNGWWITQSLASQSVSEPWLIHWSGSTVDYNSAISGLSIVRSYGAMDIDLTRERLVLGGLGYIALLDFSLAPGSVLVEGEIPAGGDNVQDVAFDAGGNFFEINSSLRRLRAYSPDGGPNSFITTCPPSQRIHVGADSTGILQTYWSVYQ